MKNLIIAIIVIMLLAGGAWYISRQSTVPFLPQTGGSTPSTTTQQVQGVQLANPASVNCVEKLNGYLQIVDEAAGQVGYCHLPDGRVCEEWGLFRDNMCTAPKS